MPLTRRQAMIKALEDAGRRGCTRRELANLGGCKWRQHLADIEDAYYLRKFRSRFGRGDTYRWVLLAERIDLVGESCELPAQVHLFEPPAPAPIGHWVEAAA